MKHESTYIVLSSYEFFGERYHIKIKEDQKKIKPNKPPNKKKGNILKLLKEFKCNPRFYRLYGRMATPEGSRCIWAFLHVLPTPTQCESIPPQLYFQ